MQKAQSPAAKTPREREYIAALSGFFKPGKQDYQARIDAYSAAMATLYTRFPEDVDAGAFYALSLLAADPPDDTTLTHQRNALAVLTPLFERNPVHPGLAHYIIHACDPPALAQKGLAAAQRYGDIAPSAPHAAHMPGHIFARLGMWQQDIDANLASVAASQRAEAAHRSGAFDQLHADDFLLYAYLQSAKVAAGRRQAGKEFASSLDGGRDSATVLREFLETARTFRPKASSRARPPPLTIWRKCPLWLTVTACAECSPITAANSRSSILSKCATGNRPWRSSPLPRLLLKRRPPFTGPE